MGFGGVGDMEETIEQLVNGMRDCVIMHCMANTRLRDLAKTRLLMVRGLEPSLHKIMLIVTGVVDEKVWKCRYLMAWLMNHRGYRATIVFISPLNINKMPNYVRANIDRCVCVNGIIRKEGRKA